MKWILLEIHTSLLIVHLFLSSAGNSNLVILKPYRDILSLVPSLVLCPVLVACLKLDIDPDKVSRTIRKSGITKSTSICTVMVLFMWGACFCMGAHKHDVAVVMKMGA